MSDDLDNCREYVNPNQRDSDNDGYGNWCDPDYDNNGIVNFGDFIRFVRAWGSDDFDIDLNDDGIINFGDFVIFVHYFFGPPGPGAKP